MRGFSGGEVAEALIPLAGSFAKKTIVPRTLSLIIALLLCVVAAPHRAVAEDLQPMLAAAMKGTGTPALSAAVICGGKLAALSVHGRRRIDRPIL